MSILQSRQRLPLIRIITVGAFRSRLPSLCRKNIRESAIDAVLDLKEDLASALYIDLDDPVIAYGLNQLGSSGLNWINDAEMVIMMSDGTQREKYNGVL